MQYVSLSGVRISGINFCKITPLLTFLSTQSYYNVNYNIDLDT